MNTSTIHKVKADIDRDLDAGIKRLASRGNTRGIELRWRKHVEVRHRLTCPPFAGKDVANLKTLLGEYPDTQEVMIAAIDHWAMLRQQPNLSLLGPLPTFGEFFSHRHKIYAWLKAEERRVKPISPPVSKREETSEELTREKLPQIVLIDTPKRPEGEFMRLFREARAKERQLKEDSHG